MESTLLILGRKSRTLRCQNFSIRSPFCLFWNSKFTAGKFHNLAPVPFEELHPREGHSTRTVLVVSPVFAQDIKNSDRKRFWTIYLTHSQLQLHRIYTVLVVPPNLKFIIKNPHFDKLCVQSKFCELQG